MEIQTYLHRLLRKDFRLNLEPMRYVCDALGNPERAYPVIHVAGTNGKGSTCAFLETLLRHSGKRVGLITSPHLVDLRERIQINREMISSAHLESVVKKIQHILPEPDFLSFFEMLVLAGFEYFREKNVDVAVVEVGLGGRLDATNIVNPAVTVLTPISMDHQEFLGDTLEKIAHEKCGILKKGAPVVSVLQSPEVQRVIEEKCRSLDITPHFVSPLSEQIALGLPGEHQKQNAALALKAAEIFLKGYHLRTIGCHPREGGDLMRSKMDSRLQHAGMTMGMSWIKALANTTWPGRLQTISKNPLVIVDGAHNPAGAKTLAEYLKQHHAGRHITLLFGCMKDKDAIEMAQILGPVASKIICVELAGERAAKAKNLVNTWNKIGFSAEVGESPREAYDQICAILRADQMLVVTGSLFLVGEVLVAG